MGNQANSPVDFGDLTLEPTDDSAIQGMRPRGTRVSSSDDGDYTADPDSGAMAYGDDPFGLDDDGSLGDDSGDDSDDVMGSDDSDSDDGADDASMDAFLQSLLSVPQDTTISHPKHGKKTVKKGTYRVRHKKTSKVKANVKRLRRSKASASRKHSGSGSSTTHAKK